MKITDALCGRTVEYVVREENGDLTLATTCGHQIRLTVKEGQIELDRVGVKFALPSLGILGGAARF
jgi:hypothetical protein